MATAEGTRLFLSRAVERGALHLSNVRTLPKSGGLACAAIGFGGYRVGGGDKVDTHRAAIRSSLRSGVNLIDTSTHYAAAASGKDVGHGASERLIGRVIAEAVAEGEAAREELIVCTKVGHADRSGGQPAGAVTIPNPHGADDYYSLDPGFLEAEVRASKERLGTAPDFVLLHNPDHFLSAQMLQRVNIADAWDEMYSRLTTAFKTLERLCDEGVIAHGYGVSSNFLSCMFSTTGRGNLYEALCIDRVLDAAVAAGGETSHRFRIAQLPLNAVENGALLGRGDVVAEAAEGDCALAERLGVAVVTHRSLNTIPVPGVSSGDWTNPRGPTGHLVLKSKQPMGTIEALLQRVLRENLSQGDEIIPLQQTAIRMSLSAPAVVCSLVGMRTEKYVQDAAAVLQQPPLPVEEVSSAMLKVRAVMEELGGQKRGLW
eukprot:gnl/TRDRNA2_/TRDRNA2_29473_c0_seq1.p1 gnl/TRDRNA2_/TRDRNA2_29473_c0~~gnl/TRDRNA2_/TRDRNA2_29473_c0_seq1.p1  ORF type:complete len:430 (+),score=83.42 gnl/TRDRNA2_/TRDRNA2_29473_c0_seq1:25-1314(+)